MAKAVCVFCSSSARVPEPFFDAARALGAGIGQRGWTLVFGGTAAGLMQEVAAAARSAGARVIGVIPASIAGRAYDGVDELVVAQTLGERKEIMLSRADAFVALPGGFGTLDEVLEVLALKQLGVHGKPIVRLNVCGFYDALERLFDDMVRQRFIKPKHRALLHVARDVPDAFARL